MLLKFSEWVNVLNESCDLLSETNVEEGRNFRYQQGNTGGAFGKKKNVGYTHSREDQRNLKGDYSAQIAFGKAQEQKIFAAAQSCGLKISPASSYEDRVLKIDGWWWPQEGGQKVAVSMKYRDTGPDLLFEVIKPYTTEPILDPKNFLGRDVKPPGGAANSFNANAPNGAKYILFLAKEGNKLSIIPAEPCYEIIGSMLHEVNDRGWNQDKDGRKAHVTSKGVLRLQTDGSSGKIKVMAYLPMRVVTPVFQCNVDVSIG